MTAKVSIYILNHNYSKYLSKAVHSVINQSHKPFEIILIDDGSTDNSLETIREINKSYPHIQIIQQENMGMIAACNKALSLASGDYIVRLDADDMLKPNAIETLVTYACRYPESDWIFPGFYYCDTAGQITESENRGESPFFISENDPPPHGACSLIKRNTLVELGGYSKHITCRDGWDLFLKLKDKKSILSVPEHLFYYRQHGANLTCNKDLLRENEAKLLDGVIE